MAQEARAGCAGSVAGCWDVGVKTPFLHPNLRGRAGMGASIVGLSLLILSARTLAADDTSATPPAASRKGHLYGVALLASTLVYRPPGGSFEGPQKDISPALGAGYFLSDTLAIELEVGPTLVTGKYRSFGFRPALSWNFRSFMYVAARFVVPVDPELDLVVLPAFGLTHTLAKGIAPFFEVGLASAVGRGEPDFGLVHLLGLTYLF
jgi:hypothetical protein